MSHDDDLERRASEIEGDPDLEEFEIYRDFFGGEPSREVVDSVRWAHEASHLAFLGELQWAQDLLYKPDDKNARILACLRAYRAVDWYDTQLSNAIVAAFVQPFARLFVKGIKPRHFLQPHVLKTLRAAVLYEAFSGTTVPTVPDTIATFYEKHDPIRHDLVHGLRVPTLEESRATVGDAILVYNRADAALNRGATHPLRLPTLVEVGVEPPAPSECS